jgi:hypothetical protein
LRPSRVLKIEGGRGRREEEERRKRRRVEEIYIYVDHFPLDDDCKLISLKYFLKDEEAALRMRDK